MSFILDALRKSEHARERRALPGLVDVAVTRGRPSRLPWILGGIGALLIVNIGVLLWVLARPVATPAAPATSPAPAAAVAPLPAPMMPAASPPMPVTARPSAVRPLAGEIEPGDDPELGPALPPVARAPARSARDEPPAAPAHATERAAAAREFQPGVAVTGLPSIHQLSPQATAGLPALNIDLHVYSGNSAQRFVIINGQRLHEGGSLKEGPTVERITPDGAILDHRGMRFLLPRE